MQQKTALHIVQILTFLGVIVASFTIDQYLSILQQQAQNIENPITICDLSKTFSCTAVAKSDYSSLFGIPNGIWGILFYGVILAISHLAENKKGMYPLNHAQTVNVVFYLAAFGFVYAMYLTSIEAFVLQAYCIFCVASAIISTLVFVFAKIATKKTFKQLFSLFIP